VAPGFERAVPIVADCLLHPGFREDDIDAERRALVQRFAAGDGRAEAGSRAALRLFHDTLKPGAPHADRETLPSLTRVRLLDLYRRRYPPSRLVVAVVGDLDPQRAVAALASAFSDVPADRPRPTPVAPPAPATTSPPAAEPTTVFRTGAGSDADVVIGYPTFPPGDPDRLPMELLSEILAGEGGRLWNALRGDATLAYSVRGRTPAGPDPGYFAVALTCAPAHVESAVAAVRSAFAAVAASGVTADEVGRAARRLIGARAAALRSGEGIAHALVVDETRGLPPLAYRTYAAAVARVRADDVARAARRALDPRHEVIAVVTGTGK